MFIYKITNKVNGKIYVGQTSETLKQRMSRHMGYQKDKCDSKFYRAVRKYGVENFEISVLEEVEDKEKLDIREVYWIDKLNTIEDGYNTFRYIKGGDTLTKHPNREHICKKISEAVKGGNNPNATCVMVINIKSGYMHLFDSMKTCQQVMCIPRHDIISRRCRHIIKKPYRERYLFEYVAKCGTTSKRVALE